MRNCSEAASSAFRITWLVSCFSTNRALTADADRTRTDKLEIFIVDRTAVERNGCENTMYEDGQQLCYLIRRH